MAEGGSLPTHPCAAPPFDVPRCPRSSAAQHGYLVLEGSKQSHAVRAMAPRGRKGRLDHALMLERWCTCTCTCTRACTRVHVHMRSCSSAGAMRVHVHVHVHMHMHVYVHVWCMHMLMLMC